MKKNNILNHLEIAKRSFRMLTPAMIYTQMEHRALFLWIIETFFHPNCPFRKVEYSNIFLFAYDSPFHFNKDAFIEEIECLQSQIYRDLFFRFLK